VLFNFSFVTFAHYSFYLNLVGIFFSRNHLRSLRRVLNAMNLQRFPSHLLDQSISERVAYFENYKVNHPKLQKIFKLVMDSIRKPDGASLIAVYGPTGVGKTTLRLKIEQRLIEEALSQLEIDRGKIPVIAVEAVAPESGNFNWKDYYTRALIALE
jgi:DNA replication protein DnaC